MKKIVFILLALPFWANSQTLLQSNTFGLGARESCNKIIFTEDTSAVIMVGATESYGFGGFDFWTTKISFTGNQIWKAANGGLGNDELLDITSSHNGSFGYIGNQMVGWSDSPGTGGNIHYPHGGQDLVSSFIGTDSVRGPNTNYGGTFHDVGTSIVEMPDEKLTMAGWTNSTNGDVLENFGGYDGWILWTKANGTIERSLSFGGSGDDKFYSLKTTTDNRSYIVCGETNSTDSGIVTHGGKDFWVLKIYQMVFFKEWQKCFGGTGDDVAYCAIETSDGGFIIVGKTNSTDGDIAFNHGDYDYLAIKIDASGNIVWKKTYGGSNRDEATNVVEVSNNSYIITGRSNSNNGDVSGNHGGFDWWIINVDSLGTLLWQKSYGGSADDSAANAIVAPDGSIFIGGTTYSSDGDVAGNHGSSDFWLIRISRTSTGITEEENYSPISIYPNPASSFIDVTLGSISGNRAELIISNLSGQIVYRKNLNLSGARSRIEVSDFAKGLYFLQVIADDRRFVSKFIVQ